MQDLTEALTVVFVVYKSEDVLPAALETVSAHLPRAEIVVVDNGSTLAQDQLHTWAPTAHLVTGQGNVGFGSGVNLGIRAASAPHVLVLNPDATLIEYRVADLSAAFRDSTFGVLAATERCGSRMVPLLVPVRPWPVSLTASMFRWFIAPRGFPAFRVQTPRTRLRFSGAAFLIRRSEFLELGGFDERIFLYHEDEELSARYSAEGFPVRATGAVVVEHDQGTSSPRDNALVLAWQLLGFLQMLHSSRGPRTARAASTMVFGYLGLVSLIGRLLSHAPLVGSQAAKKRQYAKAVGRMMRSEAAAPPQERSFVDVRTDVAR